MEICSSSSREEEEEEEGRGHTGTGEWKRVRRRGQQASVGVTRVTHWSPGEDGDQRPVGGAVALAQVVQGRFDDVRGEVRRVGCRIQFPERRRVISSSPKRRSRLLSSKQKVIVFSLTRASPCEEPQVSSVTISPAAFVQSHQQLHHDVCQVVVYQVVDFLRTSAQTRRCFKTGGRTTR